MAKRLSLATRRQHGEIAAEHSHNSTQVLRALMSAYDCPWMIALEL
jgi:hypothetical protein